MHRVDVSFRGPEGRSLSAPSCLWPTALALRYENVRTYGLFDAYMRRVQAMTAIFTTIGSAADYGTFGRWLLLIITVICWASQFARMSLTCPSILEVFFFYYL